MAQQKIIARFARMWPRVLFDGSKLSEWAADVRKHLDLPGVYILYRDEHPYYVGQTKKALFNRIWNHANRPGRYFNFWNFVSAFVVPHKENLDQVEGLLITSMPTANRATPKIKRIEFPLRAWKKIRRARREGTLP